MMSGEKLYALYEEGNSTLNNCIVDTWEQLSTDDKAVWERMAEDINDHTQRAITDVFT